MRLADVMLAKGAVHPVAMRSSSPTVRDKANLAVKYMLETLADSPVVVADNVYQYVRSHAESFELYELPCAAPPFPVMWVEWQQNNGSRVGVLAAADEGPFNARGLVPAEGEGANGYVRLQQSPSIPSLRKPEADPDAEMIRSVAEGWSHLWQSENLPSAESWDQVRWIWRLSVSLQKGGAGPVWMSVLRMQAALDEWGRLLDVTYDYQVEAPDTAFGLDAFHIFAMTVNFMQCSNVRTVYVEPPAALSRKHRRKGHIAQDLVKYHVLRLDPVGPEQRQRSMATDRSGGTAFHLVRGTFRHYGDCCPGMHPPKGKLFGRLTGRFWTPMHVRGDASQGQVVTDFVIGNVPRDPTPDVGGAG